MVKLRCWILVYLGSFLSTDPWGGQLVALMHLGTRGDDFDVLDHHPGYRVPCTREVNPSKHATPQTIAYIHDNMSMERGTCGPDGHRYFVFNRGVGRQPPKFQAVQGASSLEGFRSDRPRLKQKQRSSEPVRRGRVGLGRMSRRRWRDAYCYGFRYIYC